MARKDSRMIARGDDGLMPAQREFLQKYAETGLESEAREVLNLTASRVRNWMRSDAAFKEAYAQAVSGIHEAVELKLKVQEEKLPEAIDELLNAEKTKRVACPKCDHSFLVQVANEAIRAKIVTMLMKSQGHLKEVHRVEGGIQVDITEISFGQSLALSMYQKGKQISEQSRRELVQQGFIEDDPQIDITVDGESKRLEGE